MSVDTLERGTMVKKQARSEKRRHTAMLRVEGTALEEAKLAASMMRMSLADYASKILLEAAKKDIAREAKKLAGGEK